MRIELRDAGGVRVIACAGRLTLDEGHRSLVRSCDAALDAGTRSLVVDLTGLEYLDSAGVGALVACAKHAGERGAVMRIALAPLGIVSRIFELLRLDLAFELFDGVDDAVRSFRS